MRDPSKSTPGQTLIATSFAALAVLAGCAERGDGARTHVNGPSAGGGGEGGGVVEEVVEESLCPIDCSAINAPDCYESVCNEGQHPGEVGNCVIIASSPDTECEDGLFCTVGDRCHEGLCQGGGVNTCDMSPEACQEITCDEATKSCSTAASADGASCTADDLCQINSTCQAGVCVGAAKDCLFSPAAECSTASCDPQTGDCVGAPDPLKDGEPCWQTGDVCMTDKVCEAGACGGGTAKDCSSLTVGCQLGVCNAQNGQCQAEAIGQGEPCFDGVDACNSGECDANQTCVLSPVADGTSCNDFNSCTEADECDSGTCQGSLLNDCTVYFEETFEVTCPPAGWTVNAGWDCGMPTVGPAAAFGGDNVLATAVDGVYENGLTWAGANSDTPPIDLTTASDPKLTFRVWIHTEGSSFDGTNVKISSDGGATFAVLDTVTPPYELTVASEPAWGGDLSAQGWFPVVADLSAFVGEQVIVRFSFRSDSSIVKDGVFIDDVAVVEGSAIPLELADAAELPSALSGVPYNQLMQKLGGSGNSTWSIVDGTNHDWLAIDTATGVLSGTPGDAELGPVSVTVRVEEPTNLSNFAEETFDLEVMSPLFLESFEGTCPNGFTLSGDWECGTPATEGPSEAYSGMQCIGTQIDAKYNNGQAWTTATADSPPIDLTSANDPELTFRTWIHTEGKTYDGANVKVTEDGGQTWQALTVVEPLYDLTIDGQPAWGGDQSALGWQFFAGDLSAYVGKTIQLRFAFRSDGSLNEPGVYIDDVVVAD